ncbi:threonine synthase [Aliikangiella sp. IMCC44359]|uniref:threonine synthase n=1 Tax=Aliikangiella sp. IMCC44359 TaxID=3459125 RepID=UPI00403B10F7
MKLYNLKDESQSVDFETAVKTGLGRKQGLFFPKQLLPLNNIEALLKMDVHQRNYEILKPFVGENISDEQLSQIIQKTFAFPAKLKNVTKNEYCLELFHGPTLAFKDFGANFMANCLQSFVDEKPITILTATSGDTGAAVAHAFHGLKNIQVVILFPKGKISELQQKMFTTLGNNIHTVAVEGSFDDCQQLVKQSFDQAELVETIGLNSANSINISRLLAQVCYYFDAFAQLPVEQRNEVVVAVPSGNFGNLCAGIIAKTLGLPVKRFIASTNVNDTVPRYLQTGQWSPKETIATISNAMDVSKPNNWPRIEYLMDSDQFDSNALTGGAVDEDKTAATMRELYKHGYISEPHAAVAYSGLHESLQPGETGIFLGTAHPAKFKSTVEEILQLEIPLPEELAKCSVKDDLSTEMTADFSKLENYLYSLKK